MSNGPAIQTWTVINPHGDDIPRAIGDTIFAHYQRREESNGSILHLWPKDFNLFTTEAIEGYEPYDEYDEEISVERMQAVYRWLEEKNLHERYDVRVYIWW